MRRLIAAAGRAFAAFIAFIVRVFTALRLMRKLNYSRRLAWLKAAR